MKIVIVLGTRPEIIKLSPLIHRLNKHDIVIHTNQHYSHNMDTIFFCDLHLRPPKYNLKVGSHSHGKQTGIMLEKIEEILIQEKPDIVIVQGDTNSALAGALAAAKLNIPVAHIEAGLRSSDFTMPEEKNRILIDHISTILFAPTNKSKENLLREGINNNKIHVVGNTVVDALKRNMNFAIKPSNFSFEEVKDYFLLTLHRAENVDNSDRLKFLFNQIITLTKYYPKVRIIFPIHPRTLKRIKQFHISLPSSFIITDPVGYLEFLFLEKNAKLILTDSGGIQEEACVLGIPCITLRTSTERPETIHEGCNILMSNNLVKDVQLMFNKNIVPSTIFGNNVVEKIITILRKAVN